MSARSHVVETRDLVIALVLGVLTGLSRLPFVAHRHWEWDSVLYARALEQGFHVDDVLSGSRPHPPGYIFYVAAAALAKAAGLDSDHALVAVSVVASGVAAGLCYLLCRRYAGPPLSLALAIAFAASPLVWLHGEVAMPYLLLAPISAGLALAFRDARGQGVRRAVVASFAFGALGGFRQDLLLFLFPLWVWMLWPDTGARLRSAVALLAGCGLWLLPSAALSDGLIAYAMRSLGQLTGVSGVSANAERSIPLNAVLVGDSLFWGGLLVFVALLVLGLARALASVRGQRLPDDAEAGFFALWLLPALLFYLFVHIGEWGFVLSLVPGMYALVAWLLCRLSARRATAVALVLANAALAAALFLTGDDPVFSRASLVAHDRSTDARTSWIRDQAPPGSIVLAAAEVLVASYYLPDRVVRYSNAAATATHGLPIDGPTTIVIYEPAARPLDVRAARTVELGQGITLQLAEVPSGTLRLGGSDIGDAR